jgi:hypothetical protein
MQFYIQFVAQWQKACSDAAFWMKTAALQGGGLRH